MDFTCRGCEAQLTTSDVARQTLAVPSCYSVDDQTFHSGPFELNQQTGHFQQRPMIMPNVQRRVDH